MITLNRMDEIRAVYIFFLSFLKQITYDAGKNGRGPLSTAPENI